MTFHVFLKEEDVIITSSHPETGKKSKRLLREGYLYKYSFTAFDKGANYDVIGPYKKNLQKVLEV